MAKQRKYEFTNETAYISRYTVLKRIRALIDIPRHNVKAGDLGGWIQKVSNLPHNNEAWVAEDAKVYGDAVIEDESLISGKADVSGKSHVFGESRILENAKLKENVTVINSEVQGMCLIKGYATVKKSKIYGTTCIKDNVFVDDSHVDMFLSDILNQAHIVGTSIFGSELLFKDNVRIVNSTIGLPLSEMTSKCTFLGKCELNETHIDGANDIQIDGHALLVNGVQINGNKVRVDGYTKIVGNISLCSNTIISDMVHIEKKNGTHHKITNVEYVGDTCVML